MKTLLYRLYCFFFLSIVIVMNSGIHGFSQSSRIIIDNGGIIVIDGGSSSTPMYLVVDNSTTTAISRNVSGHIITTSEYNWVQWNVRTTAGAFTFPMGRSNTTYIPFVFDKTAGTESTIGRVALSSWYDADNSPTPNGTLLCGAETNVVDRYWIIDVQGYSANPTADIYFYYDNPFELDGIPEVDLQAQRWNSSLPGPCKWEPPVGTVNTTNDYVTYNTSSFSPWVLVNKNYPLPIELLSFDAFPENNSMIKCEWITATESNNSHFVIERSENGVDFFDIGTKPAAGNSNVPLNYDFTDYEPKKGVSYYRLRQVDFDGSFSYSSIRDVYIGTINIISIYPNPSNTYLQYVVASETGGTISVKVHDMFGRDVINKQETVEPGVNALKIDVKNLSSGAYLLQVANEKLEVTQKQFVIN